MIAWRSRARSRPGSSASGSGWRRRRQVGGFLALDVPASSAPTRELLGWDPVHPGLIADLDEGHYFEPARQAA